MFRIGSGATIRNKVRFGKTSDAPGIPDDHAALTITQPSSSGALGSCASAEAVEVAAAITAKSQFDAPEGDMISEPDDIPHGDPEA